jgi:hypothetical protein
MKKICSKDIHRQITSLIPIIELCMTLTTSIERTNNKLNTLPEELEKLRKQANFLKSRSSEKPTLALLSQLEQTEFELDSLVDDLDKILLDLIGFDRKLKNIIALKERLEAIQEERINGLTPERIYKLLERPRERSLQADSKNNSKLKTEESDNWKKKNLNDKLRHPKIAVSIALFAALSLGWMAGYHSSVNLELNNNKAVESTK